MDKLDTSYWLMKTEPDVFSIYDLFKSKNKTAPWDGVRNYQARNFLRDNFKIDDKVLIYHSSCAEPGIAGIGVIVKEAYADPSALDEHSPFFDSKPPKSGNTRWFMVDIKGEEIFKEIYTLKKIKADPKLKEMLVCQKGSRLSIQPVTEQNFLHIVRN